MKSYLDEKVETARVVVAADGGVAAGYEFAVDVCRDRDVLTDRKTENVEHAGKLETVTGEGNEGSVKGERT